jgi:hypothetical protein
MALSYLGDTLLIGSPTKTTYYETVETQLGLVYHYSRKLSSWKQQSVLSQPNGISFGTALALSGDGKIAVIGSRITYVPA